jgi:hypothetical protein
MSHAHIVSFCGIAGCAERPYHANTEDLVSPALSPAQVEAYRAETGLDAEAGYVEAEVACHGSPCINTVSHWVYLRPDDRLMAAHRPGHYDPDYFAPGGPGAAGDCWAGLTGG